MKRGGCFICGFAISGYDPLPVPSGPLNRVRFWAGMKAISVGRRFMRLAHGLIDGHLTGSEP